MYSPERGRELWYFFSINNTNFLRNVFPRKGTRIQYRNCHHNIDAFKKCIPPKGDENPQNGQGLSAVFSNLRNVFPRKGTRTIACMLLCRSKKIVKKCIPPKGDENPVTCQRKNLFLRVKKCITP